MGVKLFHYMGGCDNDDDDNDDNDNGNDGGWLILPCVCDVCLQFCWVSVGARKQNCHYHLFIQTRPATIMMIMMITRVAVMVSAKVDLRVIPSSVCDMCLHSYWVSIGVVITISLFKQGLAITMMMIMMITIMAVMLDDWSSHVFVTCACNFVGYQWVQGNKIAITISSFKQGRLR